jgi:hypothetical protein
MSAKSKPKSKPKPLRRKEPIHIRDTIVGLQASVCHAHGHAHGMACMTPRESACSSCVRVCVCGSRPNVHPYDAMVAVDPLVARGLLNKTALLDGALHNKAVLCRKRPTESIGGITATDPVILDDPSLDELPLSAMHHAPIYHPAYQYAHTDAFNPMCGVASPVVGVNLSIVVYREAEDEAYENYPSESNDAQAQLRSRQQECTHAYSHTLGRIRSLDGGPGEWSHLQASCELLKQHMEQLEAKSEEGDTHRRAFAGPVGGVHLHPVAGPLKYQLPSRIDCNITGVLQANGPHQGVFGQRVADTIVVSLDAQLIANSSSTNGQLPQWA